MTQASRATAGSADRLRVRVCVARGIAYAHEIWLGRASDDWMARARLASKGSPQRGLARQPAAAIAALRATRAGAPQSALLVGMAGKSHWSVSVELDPAPAGVHFDVACRVRGASRPLWAARIGDAARVRRCSGTRPTSSSHAVAATHVRWSCSATVEPARA